MSPLRPFTVVLLRPDYLCDDTPYGQDIYVAIVNARDKMASIKVAQTEVFQADVKEGAEPLYHEHYKLCVLFEGHHDPKLFGWQL